VQKELVFSSVVIVLEIRVDAVDSHDHLTGERALCVQRQSIFMAKTRIGHKNGENTSQTWLYVSSLTGVIS
jgi:hypothetical protein